ncbi:MAG: potassium channel family protein [Actinomycetota bacterium]
MAKETDVLVVGLGRFGGAVAQTLTRLGSEVLGIDQSARLVQTFSNRITHAVEADSTDIEALQQLGVQDFQHAVVAIGSDLEASILTVAALVDLEIPHIWAKAVTVAHGKILERVGAHDVVFPERDMGERIAHRVTGKMIDYIDLDDTFSLAETGPPRALVGKTLEEYGVRAKHDVTVVCIRPEGGNFTYATADTKVGPNDVLVVAGETKATERFADLD